MEDISKTGLPVPTREEKTEKLVTESVLIFYRSLGMPQDSIDKIVKRGLRTHRIAMKKAIAHILGNRMNHAELFDLIGPIPDIHRKPSPDIM